MLTMKKKSHVSITFNEYVLRALVSKDAQLEQTALYEIALPKAIVEEGTIVDEMAFFQLIRDNVAKWGGKKQNVRFLVPDTSVLLKNFEHPSELKGNALKEYVQMEIGHTIHLSFQDPLIDVYDATEGDGQAVLFAVPPDEVGKLIGILLDAHLEPKVADIRALCNLRLLEHIQFIDEQKTYLITDWSINELSICIYSNGHVEFLRFQPIHSNLCQWEQMPDEKDRVTFKYIGNEEDFRASIIDQVLDLDRMMNFFKFSLHKGERVVDEIVVMGEHPQLEKIEQLLSENLITDVRRVSDAHIQAYFPKYAARHATLLGLAIKGQHNDSRYKFDARNRKTRNNLEDKLYINRYFKLNSCSDFSVGVP